MSDDLRISLVIGADGKAAVEGVSKVGSSLASMKKEAADSGGVIASASSRMASSLRSLSAAAAAAFGIYKVSAAATDLVKESTLLAARSETLDVVMSRIGVNAGYTSGQMRSYMEAVRESGITTIQSQEAVIRMTQAHLDLAQASKLARVAQDAAVIGNVNSSEAMERLLHGITTLQPEILRTIGITVNFEQEYAKAAAQMGKSATALSQQEKQQIAFNAVMSRGEDIAGSYEAAMGTAGKQMGSLSRLTEEAKLQIGQAFNPAFTILIRAVSEEVKGLSNWLVRMKEEGKIAQWSAAFSSAARSAWSSAKTLGEMMAWTAGKISMFWEVGQAVAAGMGALWVIKWAAASTAVSNFLFYAKNAGFMVEYLSVAVLPGLVSPAGIAAAAVGLLAYAFINVGRESRDAERDIKAFETRAAGMSMEEASAHLAGFTDQLIETRRRLQGLADMHVSGDLGLDLGLTAAGAEATVLEGKIKAAEDRLAQLKKQREIEEKQVAAAKAKAEQDRKGQVNAQLEAQLTEGTRKAGVGALPDRMAQIDAEAAHYIAQGAKKATADRWAAAQKIKAAEEAHRKVQEFLASESQSEEEQLEQKIRDLEREGASFNDLVLAWEAGYERIERKRGADAAKANEEWEHRMTEQAAAEELARANVALQSAESVARRKQELNQMALQAGTITESQVIREKYAGERAVLKAKEDQVFASLAAAKTEAEHIRLAGEYKAIREEIVFLEEREAYELGARSLQLQSEITDLMVQQRDLAKQQDVARREAAFSKIGADTLGTLAGFAGDIRYGQDRYAKEYQEWEALQLQRIARMEELGYAESAINDEFAEADIHREYMMQERKIGMIEAGFSAASSLADAFYRMSGNKSKAAFRAYQTMKSGETVISTASAAMKAFDDGNKINYWVGVGYAAATVAMGAAQLAAIWSASPTGGNRSVGGAPSSFSASGGAAPGVAGGGDTQTDTDKTPTYNPTINIYVAGNVIDQDAFARELVPSITKAIADNANQ